MAQERSSGGAVRDASRLVAGLWAGLGALAVVGLGLGSLGRGWVLLGTVVFVGLAIVAGYAGQKLLILVARGEGERLDAERRVREAQREAQEGTATTDALTDGLDVAILTCDARAGVQYANGRALAMFGGGALVGRSLLSLTLSPELDAMVREVAERGEALTREIAFSTPVERVVLAKAWRPNLARRRTFLSLIEITDLRRLERVRRDFVANVSHELRTPLTIIRAYAETLQDDDTDDLRERYLAKIVGEVDRLTSISQDLLVLATSEGSPVRKGACDLDDVVRAVVGELRRGAEERDQLVDYESPGAVLVEANAAQMTQVAINLVENAMKYSPAGATIRVGLGYDDAWAVLTVGDEGIGIASEHVDRIFERFYRVDRGPRARERGDGPRPRDRQTHRRGPRGHDRGREHPQRRLVLRRAPARGHAPRALTGI